MSVQHLFKFQTESDYKTAKNNHLIIPNISNVIESGKTYISSKFSTKETAEIGDIIVFHEETDGTKTIRYMKPEAFDRTDGYWTADAIVVVPYNHTNDGTVRAMALKYASVTTPEEGSEKGEFITWGAKIEIDGLKQYGGKTTFSSIEDQTFDSTVTVESEYDTVDLPTDDLFSEGVIVNPYDRQTCYIAEAAEEDYKICSSPFNNDGTPNDAYHSTGDFSIFTENLLQDMDGAENTLTILKELDQNHLDQTLYAQTLDNEQTKTVDGEVLELYPVASACARYGSVLKPCVFDTSKSVEENIATMPWYAPSAGELGYVVVRKARILYALTQVLGNLDGRKGGVFTSTVGKIGKTVDVFYPEGAMSGNAVTFESTMEYNMIDSNNRGNAAIPFCKF